MLRKLFFLAVIAAAIGMFAPKTSAKTPSGVTVSPAFQQVTISPGETTHPTTFTITNDLSKPQTFKLAVTDFNTLGESGGLFFVGTNPTELQKKYGLAKWFRLDQDLITVGPKQSVQVKAEILNLPDLSPGGHYGALMVEDQNQNQSSAKPNNVKLQPIASSLLFVTKVGGDTHKLSLSGVTAAHGIFNLPSSVNLLFHNDGNSHLIPRGNITITNSKGQLFKKGIINQDSNIILPETSRQYIVPLNQLKSASSGTYYLRVDFRFDGINQYRTYQQKITYFSPVSWLLLIIVVVATGLFYKLGWLKKLAQRIKRR